MPIRRHPHILELNARLVVERLSTQRGRRVTLGTIPGADWDRLRERGFDLVWPMGVWTRSAASRRIASSHPGLRAEYDRALPGWNDDDIGGSPYAVATYSLDPALGPADDLIALKRALNAAGLGLIVDFVPNHLAVDHAWVTSHPGRLVAGTPQAVREHPDRVYSPVAGAPLAHGRDPHSPPWTDTVQINHFAAGAREALAADLLRIAALADGVRCDMAMLVLDDTFGSTWEGLVPPAPSDGWRDFWPAAIARVRRDHPGFVCIAEAYRDHEQLLSMGFDYVYDKTLYDLLRYGDAAAVRRHLAGCASDRFVRFIENHDEPRAVQAFGERRSRAAAIIMATSPGGRLFHDGQREGHRIRLPVQLVREPPEADDPDAVRFYDRLLRLIDAPIVHAGEWRLLEATPAGAPGAGHEGLYACAWRDGGEMRVVVVNLSASPAAGRVRFDPPSGDRRSRGEHSVMLDDLLHDVSYERDRRDIIGPGLHVELQPWEAHFFRPR